MVTLPVFNHVAIKGFLASLSSTDRDWREVEVAVDMHTDGVIENDRLFGELDQRDWFKPEKLTQFKYSCRPCFHHASFQL